MGARSGARTAELERTASHRQLDVERRPARRLRLQRDPPGVLLDDRVGDGQSEAGAFSDFLRREERIEHARLHVFRHARAIVVHLENHRVFLRVVPGADDQRSAAVGAEHRLFGVDDEIEQDLLNLVRVGEDAGQAGGERLEDVDVAQPLFVAAQRERLAHHLVEVDHRPRGVALAREGQEVPDDPGGALRFGEDGVEAALRRLVHLALREAFGPGQDRRQRIVQLVRDAGDRLAERGELFGLQQLVIEIARLVLEPLALADVAHQRLDAQRRAIRVLGVRRHLDPHERAIGATQPQQVIGDRAVAPQPLEKQLTRLRIDEEIDLEGSDLIAGRVGGEAEHQLEERVGEKRRAAARVHQSDVDAFVHGLEQAREGLAGEAVRCRDGGIHRVDEPAVW